MGYEKNPWSHILFTKSKTPFRPPDKAN